MSFEDGLASNALAALAALLLLRSVFCFAGRVDGNAFVSVVVGGCTTFLARW